MTMKRLFVGNIPRTVSSNVLRSYFNKYGRVSYARVFFNWETGYSRRFGVVQYKTLEDSEKALGYQDHQLEGKKLSVFWEDHDRQNKRTEDEQGLKMSDPDQQGLKMS